MKIYILTDLECVAGVISFKEYCRPNGKFYEYAKKLATQEVNAAISGLLEGGATEIVIFDGHGPGGLIPSLIHPGALYKKPAKYPHGLDKSFDAQIIIGQHAMANVNGGHLCHSGSFSREKWLLNNQEIGEIGLNIIKAQYFGIPSIMISGDLAACEEAEKYIASITKVPVIEGQKRGSTSGLTTEGSIKFNVAAKHLSPEKSREMIRQGAKKCLQNIKKCKSYWITPPYEMTRISRKGNDNSSRKAINKSNDFIKLLQQKPEYTV